MGSEEPGPTAELACLARLGVRERRRRARPRDTAGLLGAHSADPALLLELRGSVRPRSHVSFMLCNAITEIMTPPTGGAPATYLECFSICAFVRTEPAGERITSASRLLTLLSASLFFDMFVDTFFLVSTVFDC